jgi:hypothetical protein
MQHVRPDPVARQRGALACLGAFALALVSCDPSEPGRYVALETHGDTNCALHSSHRAVCWGAGFPAPRVFEDVDQVSVGPWLVCMLRGTTVECVADVVDPGSTPSETVPPGEYLSVSAGRGATCAIRTDHSGVCWGFPSGGSPLPPTDVPTGEPLQEIRLSGSNACAVTSAGEALCWPPAAGSVTPTNGANYFHPLPAGTYTDAATSYADAACGVTLDREIVCSFGQCRFDVASSSVVCWDSAAVAGLIGPIPPGPFARVATSGAVYMCGLRPSGDLDCWGSDYEVIGVGQPTGHRYQAVGTGTSHVCGLTLDGEIECWGDDSQRQTDVPDTGW